LIVGGTQVLELDGSACGRAYTLEVTAANGCGDTTTHVVSCEACQPAEVSPPGTAVPFRLGLDAAGTVEFELLPEPGVTYHLYQADDLLASLAGDWSRKICDLASESAGTWTAVGPDTARWTPIVPGLIFEGYWVVIAESRSVEGPYGTVSGGFPRTPDTDGLGSVLSVGCP
jgi:hypothetical protein